MPPEVHRSRADRPLPSLAAGSLVALLSVVLLSAGCKETVIQSGGGDAGSGGSGGGGGGGQGSGAGMTVDADLEAVSLTPLTTNIEAGASLALTLRVRNLGPDEVPTFRTGVYLSTDEVFGATDVLLGTWTSPGLDASADFDVSDSAQIPVGTTPGAYRIILAADDAFQLAETLESNNRLTSSAVIQVEPPTHPDLMIESVSFGPSNVQAGSTIDVSHAVRNVGVEVSNSFRLGVYVSVDTEISNADILVGQRSIGSLAVGAADSGAGAVTIPSFVPAGTYFVGVYADDLGVITEMDELNNGLAAGAPLSVTAAPLPDLAPVSITLQQSIVDAGQPIIIEESVLNQGVASSALFQVGVYLSSDIDIDPDDDVLLGTRSVTSLESGTVSNSGPQSVTVPGLTEGGAYFVGIVIDAGGFVPESNEANNSLLASTALSVTVPPLPDLIVDDFSYGPSSVIANGTESLMVSGSFRNGGVVTSTDTAATVYLSSDAAVTAADIVLGTVSLGGLVPGAGAGRNVSIPIPGGIQNGSYRVGLWVDAEGLQPELDESNNLMVATGLLDITGGGPASPNLVAELIDPGSSLAAPGNSFQVVTRVANDGDLSSSAFRVGVYLSVDGTIDAGDTLIGDRIVPFGLGGGFSSVASGPVTIPPGLADGMYTLGVFADWQGNVTEPDELDNVLVDTTMFEVRTPPPPSPNLVVATVSATVGTTASPGEVFDVDHTVRNDGEVDAGAFRVGIYLSDDSTIDSADVLLSSRLITSLDAGASDTQTSAVQVPAGTAAGTWYVGVIADDQGAVAEGNESDNDRAHGSSFDI